MASERIRTDSADRRDAANDPISLELSDGIAAATLAHGRSMGCSPLTVAVLDPGGHLVVLKREDGSGIMRPEIAIGKAWGALGMRLPSRELGRRAEEAPAFIAAMSALAGGRFVPVPGGVLIRRSGMVIGAVGVTGDTSDRDEECAVAAITATGLEADVESKLPR